MEFEEFSIRKLFLIKNWYDFVNFNLWWKMLIDSYVSWLIFDIFCDMIRNVNSGWIKIFW